MQKFGKFQMMESTENYSSPLDYSISPGLTFSF